MEALVLQELEQVLGIVREADDSLVESNAS
jgi:hypothetical protein